MNYTQEQAKKIYQSAKDQGLNPDLVMAKLVEKGATFEGIDSNAAMQYSNKLLGKEGPGYLQRVGTDIKEQALRAKQGAEQGAAALEQGVNMTDANGIITPKGVVTAVGGALRSGLRAAGSAANAIATPIVEAPGVKQATQAVVGGAMKGIQELPGGAEAFQKLRDLAVKNPEIAKDVEDIFNLVTTGAGAKVAKVGAEGAIGVAKVGEKAVGQGLESGMKLAENVIPKSDEIMNRVARLTPKQANTFEKLAGKTHGEYLRETGNFGTPDQIIKNEAEKFTQSLKSVDDTLAKLPGTYKSGAIEDALAGLSEKAAATSSKNVKSPLLAKITEYEAKLNDGGLTMSEINDLKRLFERNVKLGYNKLMNADKVEQATNIDNALRNWQVEKAKELGFKNIADLNKQTQLSKFIVDKLGDQVVGKNGLNDVTLTDWIMLSGGDPTAVGGFLTKKFFSSKKVQSKIAELLNKGEVKGQILPEITTSKKLPQQQSEKVLEKASTNNTTSGLKSKGTIPENSLISEAKKYKSAEEFVKAKTNAYHGTDKVFDKFDLSKVGTTQKLDKYGMFFTSDKQTARNYSSLYPQKSKINWTPQDKINAEKAIVMDAFIKDSDALTFSEVMDLYEKGKIKTKVKSEGFVRPSTYFDMNRDAIKEAMDITGKDVFKITKEGETFYMVNNPDKMITKSQLEEIWKKANKNVEIEPLIQQAKKYKSADEFVKAQGSPVFRGGSDLLKEKITDAGISVSKGKNVAEEFAKQKGGKVEEIIISPNANIADYTDVPNVKFKNINDYSPELDVGNKQIWNDLEVEYQKAVNWAKENGYDGIKLPLEGETRIINKDAIKSKSQLEEIWKKANKK